MLPRIYLKGAPNVVLDTMKKAEDSNDIIVRMYEAYGGHARARLVRYVTHIRVEKLVLKSGTQIE